MDRKIVSKLAFLVSVWFLFTSCTDWFGVTGTGNIISQKRTATDFHSVSLLTAAKVYIVKGDSFKVEISDYENLLQHISIKVDNHNLTISNDPIFTVLLNSKAKVTITMPDSLLGVAIAGSGDINLNSPFKDLNTLAITGSGNIYANEPLNILAMNASILGSGNITAIGSVQTLTGLISGSGNLQLSNLNATNANCTISGSGSIYVHSNTSLKATISGSGNIIYSGNPIVDASITGSGKVFHN
jgi:translation initiation factor IF-1